MPRRLSSLFFLFSSLAEAAGTVGDAGFRRQSGCPSRIKCHSEPSVEFGLIGRTLGAVCVDAIYQAASDPKDRGSVNGLGAGLARIGLGASFERMRESLSGIGDAPGHRGRTGSVLITESAAEACPVAVKDVVHSALAAQIDGAR